MKDKMEVSVCPSTLKKGFDTYCLPAIKTVFNGKRVSHVLPFSFSEEMLTQLDISNIATALSGQQTKYYVLQNQKKWLAFEGKGNFILKPIPHHVLHASQMPANEHLTMQIATQVYKLDVVPNAMVFGEDNTPAFITRRMDIDATGKKLLVDNFATLHGISQATHQPSENYNTSYEALAQTIDQHVSTAVSAKEELLKRAIFNYLFYNGDVHVQHFSIINYAGNGEYFLAPAYNLVNTRLHTEDEKDISLTGGLYQGCTQHPSYKQLGYFAFDDFVELGKRMGLLEKRVVRFVKEMLASNAKVRTLINNSFLNNEMKVKYYALYNNKLKRLGMSVGGLR